MKKINDYTMVETRLLKVQDEEAKLEGRFISGFKNDAVTAELVREIMENSEIDIDTIDETTTVVKCVLPNNYTIIETSSCINAYEYSEEIGANKCLRKIEAQVWELLGFLYITAKNGFTVKNNLVEQALELAFDEILKEEIGDIEHIKGTKFYNIQKKRMFDSIGDDVLSSLAITANMEEMELDDIVELIVAMYLVSKEL